MQKGVSSSKLPGKWMDFRCDSKNKNRTICFPARSYFQVYISTKQTLKFMLHLDNLFYKGIPQIECQTVTTRKQTQGLIVVHVQHALR